MNDDSHSWLKSFTRPRGLGPLTRFESYIKNLSRGDRTIAYGLFVLIGGACLLSAYFVEQKLVVEVPANGGTLVEGELGSPRFVNPLLALSDADRDLAELTYAGLMGLDGSGNLIPVLAKSYTVSDDGKTYTFLLRPEAVFSDGTAVTADDVVFTVQKAQDPALKSPEYADWSGVTASVIDAHTVQFILSKPYAPFLENTILGILPARLWRAIPDEQFPFSTLTSEPVGAGPFVYAGMTRDASGLVTGYTVKANSRYIFGRPYLDKIRFVFFSQQEDLAKALANGDISSAYGIPAPGALTAPYARVFGVFWNPTSDTTFARPEVRKALSLAVDREDIVENVLGGYATALMGPVPPGSGIKETPVPSSANRVDDAAAILRNAGWTYNGNARAWENTSAKLSLDSITIKTSNVPELKAVGIAVKANWEKLGIAVDIELYEPGDLNQNVIRPRKYDALLFGMVIGREEDLYAFWDSKERNDPGLNIALYTNKNVDAFLEDARTTSDPAKRLSDLQGIEDAVANDYPAAFTHAPDFIYVVPENLKGVSLPQIATPSDRFATVASWYERTDSVWPFLVPQHN